MDSAETRLKALARRLGADLVGITTKDRLLDGPPSADPRYRLPSAKSVISFAVSLDREIVQDFMGKKAWRPHCENRKAVVQRLYTIGDGLAERLRAEGHEALNVDVNNAYRPENAARDVTEMTAFHPDGFYYTVCGFCRSVCVTAREDRLANRRLITRSGTAGLKLDGSHVVADADAVQLETPFGLQVVVPRRELAQGRIKAPDWPGQFPLDREVIRYISQHLDAADGKKHTAD